MTMVNKPSDVEGGSLSASVTYHLRNYFEAHGGDLPAPGLYNRIINEVERCLFDHTLKVLDGNQLRAADLLGINRNTLRKKMRELGIELPKKQKR